MKKLGTPAVIIIATLGWAFVADPLITSMAEQFGTQNHAIYRGINDFLIILIISFILYARIRKQQQALRKAAEDYRRLFGDIPAPLFIYDAATYKFLAVNNAAVLQYGFTREEFLTLTPANVRLEGKLQLFRDSNASFTGDYFETAYWLHQNKHGEAFYVCVYTHETFFQGKPAIQALVINIDQMVKAELELKEKSDEIENVLESITDAFYTVDKEWHFTYINKEYERVQEHKREQLLGKNVWELYPYAKELSFYQQYEKALREQVSVHFEEYNPRNGMWVSAHAYPIKNGLAVYFRDITEEKHTQEKLFNDGQNLRAIINNTRDLIWSVDHKFNIITGNKAFWERVQQLTGKTEQNITNADFEKERMKSFMSNYQRALNGEAFITTRQVESPSQSFEELSFNPIRDQKGKVIGINCSLRDITERHRHLEQIKSQNEKLKEIAWIQSHKVRDPVANLLGLVQLLEPDKNEEVIEKIRQASVRLDEAIHEISAQAAGWSNN
jgi:PAS domain S-box-containing protein